MFVKQLDNRIDAEKQVADAAYCDSLMDAFEGLIKYTVAILTALLPDNEMGCKERYRWEHSLLRSAGIGTWVGALQGLAGGALYSSLSNELTALDLPTALEDVTSRVTNEGWQHRAVSHVSRALDVATGNAPTKVPYRTNLLYFGTKFVELRNKLDSHGAPRAATKREAAGHLGVAWEAVTKNLQILNVPIVHCTKALGGGPSTVMDIGPATTGVRSAVAETHRTLGLETGVYVVASDLRLSPASLIRFDPMSGDILLANGDPRLSERSTEFLSYITNVRRRESLEMWMVPPDVVIRSDTAGFAALVPREQVFTNAPTPSRDYVERPGLQEELEAALTDERRLIVTLQGRGGIGKTWLALHCIDRACREGWFDVILWFSARDLDLRDAGASIVNPEVITLDNLAEQARGLLAEIGTGTGWTDRPSDWLAVALSSTEAGNVLWVLDNYETLRNPLEVFSHFDTFIRPGNKVLVTTRHREWVGDFPINVSGMTRDEFDALVNAESVRHGLSLADGVRDALFTESRGHPYITKIMLGELRNRPGAKPQRLLAAREDVLDALFERLSAGARRLFLLLSTWRSIVPFAAADVVLNVHRSTTASPIDTDEAVEELYDLSLIQLVVYDDQTWLDVPLPAWLFGRRKLVTDPDRIDIEAQSQVLQLFGPSTGTDVTHGLERPVRKFWQSIRDGVGSPEWEQTWGPWIASLAKRVPVLLSWVADDLENLGKGDSAQRYLRWRVEASPDDPNAWMSLARHYEARGDDRAALQAWVARALVQSATFDDLSFAANKVNGWLARSRVSLGPDEKQLLVEPLLTRFEQRAAEADAQAFSRLAWLYVNIGRPAEGIAAARRGLASNPDQQDCRKFLHKFDS